MHVNSLNILFKKSKIVLAKAKESNFLGVVESGYEFTFLAWLKNVFIGFCVSSLDPFIVSFGNGTSRLQPR